MGRPTDEIIDLWKETGSLDFDYFERAEPHTDAFWREGAEFRERFDRLDTTKVLEIACGAGRHAERAAPLCGELVITDTSEAALERARVRLHHCRNVRVLRSPDGMTVPVDEDGTFTAVYSYDAMVHFEPLCIASYLAEVGRLLRPGGLALLHHSNYELNPTAQATENPGWRNFMSEGLFAHLASRAGLEVLERRVYDWTAPQSDALSLARKIAEAGR